MTELRISIPGLVAEATVCSSPRPNNGRPCNMPERPQFIDMTLDEAFGKKGRELELDSVEFKFDGQWAEASIRTGDTHLRLVGRSGRELGQLQLKHPWGLRPCTFIGEYLVGTQRAKNSDLHGALLVFDCLVYDGEDLTRHVSLTFRRRAAEWGVTNLVDHGCLNPDGAAMACFVGARRDVLDRDWAESVLDSDVEGLVLKNSKAPWGSPWVRVKRHVTVDLVLMSHEVSCPSGVVVLTGGQFDKAGNLVEVGRVVCRDQSLAATVWNAAQEGHLLGRVFTVRGMERTAGGAIRHPVFDCWREDKPASECVLESINKED